MIRKVGFFKDEYKSKNACKTKKAKSKAHRKKRNSKKPRKTKSKGGGMTFKKTVGINRKKLRGGGDQKVCFICKCDIKTRNKGMTMINRNQIQGNNITIIGLTGERIEELWDESLLDDIKNKTEIQSKQGEIIFEPIRNKQETIIVHEPGIYRYICSDCYDNGNITPC
jgi:hypothetical protein